jgi:diaminohydroxyphosphoribosylaminopyrimidine deaminase/5-amino-6-(5-phosphoribosylamino)uracil reductase
MGLRTPDRRFLERALELAENGRNSVSPNPMVGAVVVRGGNRIVGEGYHRRAGGPHAEVVALRRAGRAAVGADLYVTLEPCHHVGRTGPCTRAIREAGIRRVIFAVGDPNPAVAGGGGPALRRAGLEVSRGDAGVRRRAAVQNEKFLTWAVAGRPFVLAKWASTIDGRIAAADGRSRWITAPAARTRALRLREEYDAVLVGAGTVLADDPRLNRRLLANRPESQWRVVLDGRLRVSPRARVFDAPGRVVVATARPPGHPRARLLSARGVEVWSLPGREGEKVSIPGLLRRLGRAGVTSLMVEGGAETLASFFAAKAVDRVCVFLAPRLLGGANAPAAIGGGGFSLPATPRLDDVRIAPVGEDWMLTARVDGRGRRRRPTR